MSMAYAVKKIDDMEAIYGGAFKRVRAELGVESFGIQIIDMPPNFEGYPDHDHARTARRRSTWRCAAAARSRSKASASRSTRTTSRGSAPASAARSGPATTASAC